MLVGRFSKRSKKADFSQVRKHPVSLLPFLLFALWTIGALAAVAIVSVFNISFYGFHILLSCLLIGAGLYIFRLVKADITTLPFALFVIIFCSFHFGMIPLYLSGENIVVAMGYPLAWYSNVNQVERAYVVSIVFLAGLLIAPVAAMMWTGFPPNKKVTRRQLPNRPFGISSMDFDFSTSVLFISIVVWFGEFKILNSVENYVDYLNLTNSQHGYANSIAVFLNPLIAASFFFSVATHRRPLVAFLIFLIWAVVAFPLGLRGEVLFPLALTLPYFFRTTEWRPSWWISAASVYGILVISSFTRLFRIGGSFSASLAGASGLLGLAELGGSLRPVYEVVGWLQSGIDHYRYGSTYVAPLDRALLLVVPFGKRVAAQFDPRLLDLVLISRTHAQYGFSIAAEAYINFGFVGAFFIGTLVGLVFLNGAKVRDRGLIFLISAAAQFALYYHVRQGFSGAFGSFVVFFAAGFLLLNVPRIFHARQFGL